MRIGRGLFALVLATFAGARCDAGQPAADDMQSAVFVDVRTPAEYAAGHIKGAILIPVDEFERRAGELEQYREQRMVVYCRSGRRSGIALQVLKARGFTLAENGGGFDGLAAHGLPTETGVPMPSAN